MSSITPSGDDRFAQLVQWVRQFPGLESADPVAASTDASFRRYFRVQGKTKSLIVMDAPPPQENCARFVQIAGFFAAMELNSARVYEADTNLGFLLLSDLGSTQYLDQLNQHPGQAQSLYKDALDTLQKMQDGGAAYLAELPNYDAPFVRMELSIFREWLCAQHLHIHFSAAENEAWDELCDLLVDNILQQEKVFVHRDYHSRNLMVMDNNNPGVLDFQDAVAGPLTYDVVSLLKDCYVKWPEKNVTERAQYFYDHSPIASRKSFPEFMRKLDLTGVQRHLKAAGIFARLLERDGKDGYLADIPRTLSYIVDLVPRYAELQFIGAFIEARILAALEKQKS